MEQANNRDYGNQDAGSTDGQDSGQSEQVEMEHELDGAIGTLDSYIKNPKLVTPETLGALRDELQSIKQAQMDEDSGESASSGSDSSPGLMAAIRSKGGGM